MDKLYKMYIDLMYSKHVIDMLSYLLLTNYLIKLITGLIIRLLINLNSVFTPRIWFIYHRLNGSSSHVLTATSLSYGKAKNSTPQKIKTPDLIELKFGG